MRISDWSSDVCSSDLAEPPAKVIVNARTGTVVINGAVRVGTAAVSHGKLTVSIKESPMVVQPAPFSRGQTAIEPSSEIEVSENYGPAFLMNPNASLSELRSEEHTSELQSLMRISYAVFCLKQKKQTQHTDNNMKSTVSN